MHPRPATAVPVVARAGTDVAVEGYRNHPEIGMPDDLTKRGGSDRTRIDISQEHELRSWAQKFGVSREQIEQAVRAVGNQADDVEMHLKGKRGTGQAERASKPGSERR
jgi:hypothetical protein